MKKLIKLINNFFIKVILFIFYFLVIGLGSLVYRLFKKKANKEHSYWRDFPKEKFDLDYFKSSY